MTIWPHAHRPDAFPEHARITLGEGNTPLVRSRHIGPVAGLNNLYFKLESCNPTGSYKDRFAAAAVSDMLAKHKQRCIATSSGNTGAALAAYCAAAAIRCSIAVVETAPRDKLAQMLAYGARLVRIRGFGSDPSITAAIFASLAEIGRDPKASLQISAYRYNPIGMLGVQTISHELREQVNRDGKSIDHVFVPAGGGGLTLAVARGFAQLVQSGDIMCSPRIDCVQPAGNDTIATPLREGATRARAVTCTSCLSGLQVPSIVDGDAVIAACRASGGSGHIINDEDAWHAQRLLAREEGIFSEPAGAVALAGVLSAARDGRIAPDGVIVCLVTASGFKDLSSIEAMTREQTVPLIEASQLQQLL